MRVRAPVLTTTRVAATEGWRDDPGGWACHSTNHGANAGGLMGTQGATRETGREHANRREDWRHHLPRRAGRKPCLARGDGEGSVIVGVPGCRPSDPAGGGPDHASLASPETCHLCQWRQETPGARPGWQRDRPAPRHPPVRCLVSPASRAHGAVPVSRRGLRSGYPRESAPEYDRRSATGCPPRQTQSTGSLLVLTEDSFVEICGWVSKDGSIAALHPRWIAQLGQPPRVIGLFHHFSCELNRLRGLPTDFFK